MPTRPSASISNILLGSTLAAASAFSLASVVAEGVAPGSLSFLSLPGSFLIGTFSWASPFVALWLAAAAVLAFLPGWRPASVAALSGSILPFLPIAAVARLGAEPEPFLSEHPYLAAAGLPALVLAGLALALALSAFVVYASRSIAAFTAAAVHQPPATWRGLLPPPSSVTVSLDGGVEAEAESAGGPDRAKTGNEEPPFEFRVPELPPLPKLRALEEAPAAKGLLEPLEALEALEEAEAAAAGADSETPGARLHGEARE